MIKISDINDPRISLYRSLKATPKKHSERNVFIVEGSKTLEKLFDSKLNIISVFALETYCEQNYKALISRGVDSNSIFFSEKQLLNEIVGFKLHEAVMAIAEQPHQSRIDEMTSSVLVLNGIVNSENVGAIVRNAVAFGINSLIFDQSTSSPYLRRAVRVSMGTIFSMKYYQSQNIINTIYEIKSNGFNIISSEVSNNSIPINNYKFPEKSAIIFGSEGTGIDKKILSISDDIIMIPINPTVPSINVAASSAIIFYYMNS